MVEIPCAKVCNDFLSFTFSARFFFCLGPIDNIVLSMILIDLGFEQNRIIINILRWCEGVSWILSLQSYMFGDSQEAVEVEARGEEDEEELGEVKEILLSV